MGTWTVEPDGHSVSIEQSKRREFYSQLSRIESSEQPLVVCKRLCELWAEATGADVAWIWLYNESSKQWQLLTTGPGDHDGVVQVESLDDNQHGLIAFCRETQTPLFVPDVGSWCDEIESRKFSVICRDWMAKNQFEAIQVVPLQLELNLGQDSNVSSNLQPVIHGSITLLYKNVADHLSQPDESLRIMGSISASRIVASFHAEQFRILMRLNQLAGEFLTRVSKRPADDRLEYLKGLTSLICEALDAIAISYFYRIPFANAVECLYSTGLRCKQTGQDIEEGDLSDVTYALGERRTGGCFKTGEQYFLPVGDPSNAEGKFVELDVTGAMIPGPALMVPIPKSSNSSLLTSRGKADGVVRCVGHPSRFGTANARNYHPLEAVMLAFICRQISPVLDMLAVRVIREHQVSVIKHDLTAPMLMIRDTVDQLDGELQKSQPLSPYLIPDLRMASFVALNLVSELDVAPKQAFECEKAKTYLEGDIIARNTAMLNYYAKQANNMSIRFDGIREIPPLMIDPLMIERVFFNLVVNAIKYGEAGTEIRVFARKSERGYHIDICNFGIGIADDERESIFKPYVRGRIAKTRKVGVGLGLYISKIFMELHDGRLQLLAPRNPTVFSMFFPRHSVARA